MNRREVVKQARKFHLESQEIAKRENIKNVFAWLDFVGLLKTRNANAYLAEINSDDLLEAAQVEPRVYELLPVIITKLSDYLSINELPADLIEVLDAIKKREAYPNYHYARPVDYLQWFGSPALELARKRLSPASKPRMKTAQGLQDLSGIAGIVKQARISGGFTQQHFAKRFNVSLRVLRDIEQGSINVSFARLREILHALGKEVHVG